MAILLHCYRILRCCHYSPIPCVLLPLPDILSPLGEPNELFSPSMRLGLTVFTEPFELVHNVCLCVDDGKRLPSRPASFFLLISPCALYCELVN